MYLYIYIHTWALCIYVQIFATLENKTILKHKNE